MEGDETIYSCGQEPTPSFWLGPKRSKKSKSSSKILVDIDKNNNRLRNSAHLQCHWHCRPALNNPRLARLLFVQYLSHGFLKRRTNSFEGIE